MYRFEADVWLWEAVEAAWHFVTLPHDVSDEIEQQMAGKTRGFGSVRVAVTIGSTSWKTSVFPDSKRKAYVLPIKKQVRTREGITAGDRTTVELAVIDA